MTPEDIVKLAHSQCKHMAYRYRQDPSELFSFVLEKLPGLHSRLDKSQPDKAQESFILLSVKGYCLHWLRDHATLIRTPRGRVPFKVAQLTPKYQPNVTLESDTVLPEWLVNLLDCVDTTPVIRRLANAYFATYYD